MIRFARENKLWQTSSSLVNRKVELSRIKIGFQYFNLAQFLEGKNQSKVLTLTQEGKQTVFFKDHGLKVLLAERHYYDS